MKKQLLFNLGSNLVVMAINMILSFWLVPFVISRLGSAAYGFIPLIQNIINYMYVITFTLNSMVGRFFTYAEKRGDLKTAESYINTACYTAIAISLVLIPVIGTMAVYINRLIIVPEGLVSDVRLTLVIQGLAFLLNSLAACMSTAAYCRNRLEVSNVVNTSSSLFRALTVILMFQLLSPKIWYVSIGSLVSVLINVVLGYISFRMLIPDVHFSIKLFSIKKCWELLSSGLWNSINWLGATLLVQIDLLVSNWLLGPLIAGQYAAVLQIPNLLRTVATSISSAFSPTTVSLYAQDNLIGLVNYTNRVIKFTGLIIGWPVTIICSLGSCLLTVWLGSDFRHYRSLLLLLTVHLTANLAVSQFNVLQQALNRIKTPALVSILLGLVNVGLAILLSEVLEMGYYGIALANGIILTVRNLVFAPLYNAYITKQSPFVYYKSLLVPVSATAVVGGAGAIISTALHLESIVHLLIASCAISVAYLLFCFILLDKRERHEGVKLVSSVIARLTGKHDTVKTLNS
jgi:membrane protein EpsK